ncbi:MAG: response regulator [Planctomycetota bacterium]
MARVLVVDDSRLDRTLVTQILEVNPELAVETAVDGADALSAIHASPPDLVLTDLVMPEPDGLALVRSLQDEYPLLPVILMTSQGSEEIAVEALRSGASSYVPKTSFGPELRNVVEEVLELARQRLSEEELHGSLMRKESTHELHNEPQLLRPLVKQVQDTLLELGWQGDSSCMQMSVALNEALHNALEHGNLEISSERRDKRMGDYEELIHRRRTEPPFRDRRIRVSCTLDRTEARFTVEDDGPGFDPGGLPDPRDPENIERFSGRGVFLMRTFMDDVEFNDRGNSVTLVKRRA